MKWALFLAGITLHWPVADAHADARVDYTLQCAGCHMADGAGLPPAVPSLQNLPAPILASAEGREYLVRIPGVAQAPLSDNELANVLNWTLAQFSAATVPPGFPAYDGPEVALLRARVLGDPARFRREHWPGLTGQ